MMKLTSQTFELTKATTPDALEALWPADVPATDVR